LSETHLIYTEDSVGISYSWEEGASKLDACGTKKYRDGYWFISFYDVKYLPSDLRSKIEQSRMGKQFKKKLESKEYLSRAVKTTNKEFTDKINSITPPGLQLFPHQISGVLFIHMNKGRAIVGDIMGTGKSATAIMYAKLTNNRTLIICPASVKYTGWIDSLLTWDPDAPISVYEAKPAKKLLKEYPEVNFFDKDNFPSEHRHSYIIITYAMVQELKWSAVHACIDGTLDSIIIDECQFIKNYRSTRTVAVRHITRYLSKSILCLSGTPLRNRPEEIFTPASMIDDDLFPQWIPFIQRYCSAERNKWGWQTKDASNLDELYMKLKSILLRRSSEDVIKLPPLHEKKVWLDSENPHPIENISIRDFAHLSTSLGLEKCYRVHALAMNRKYETSAPVIIFYHHKNVGNKLEEIFVNENTVRIDGATPALQRREIINNFQAGKIDFLLASTLATGTGITLTASQTAIFIESEWCPADMDQARKRAHRIGQTRSVTIYYVMYRNSLDEYMHDMLNDKSLIIKTAMDGKKKVLEMMK